MVDLRRQMRDRVADASIRKAGRPQPQRAVRSGNEATVNGNPLRGQTVSNEPLGTGDKHFINSDSGILQQERRRVPQPPDNSYVLLPQASIAVLYALPVEQAFENLAFRIYVAGDRDQPLLLGTITFLETMLSRRQTIWNESEPDVRVPMHRGGIVNFGKRKFLASVNDGHDFHIWDNRSGAVIYQVVPFNTYAQLFYWIGGGFWSSPPGTIYSIYQYRQGNLWSPIAYKGFTGQIRQLPTSSIGTPSVPDLGGEFVHPRFERVHEFDNSDDWKITNTYLGYTYLDCTTERPVAENPPETDRFLRQSTTYPQVLDNTYYGIIYNHRLSMGRNQTAYDYTDNNFVVRGERLRYPLAWDRSDRNQAIVAGLQTQAGLFFVRPEYATFNPVNSTWSYTELGDNTYNQFNDTYAVSHPFAQVIAGHFTTFVNSSAFFVHWKDLEHYSIPSAEIHNYPGPYPEDWKRFWHAGYFSGGFELDRLSRSQRQGIKVSRWKNGKRLKTSKINLQALCSPEDTNWIHVMGASAWSSR